MRGLGEGGGEPGIDGRLVSLTTRFAVGLGGAMLALLVCVIGGAGIAIGWPAGAVFGREDVLTGKRSSMLLGAGAGDPPEKFRGSDRRFVCTVGELIGRGLPCCEPADMGLPVCEPIGGEIAAVPGIGGLEGIGSAGRDM